MNHEPGHSPAPRRPRRPRGPGRPSKLTPQVESIVLNGIRCGASYKGACVAAGIHPTTLSAWKRKAKEQPHSEYGAFIRKLRKADQEGIVACVAHIQKAAQKDWRAAAWLLERRDPKRFSMKYRVEHGGKTELTLVDLFTRSRVDYNENKETA
jgi:transposase-like protein